MVIEFDGQITEQNQIDRLNRVTQINTILFVVTPIVIGVIGVVFGLIFDILQELWLELLLCSFIIWGIAFLNVKIPKKIALPFRIAPHIIITDENLSLELWKNGEKVWRRRSLSKVKKILDCGEVYYIIFRFGDITNAWICQKDNIVNGTIEDFQALFQSKIVQASK